MSAKLQSAYLQACMLELQALKPGNVHVFADGHGMTIEDFVKSAQVSTPVITQPDLTLGERILRSVQVTHKAVASNTNLGIILLCAPLIQAAFIQNMAGLQANINAVLRAANLKDTQACFEAICLANPGGLGASEAHDVRQPADCGLLEAMQAVQERDMIARQYVNDFADIFAGTDFYAQTLQTRNEAWAATTLYLHFLSQFPDSHIIRKYGPQAAKNVQLEAARQLADLQLLENPKLAQKALLAWDARLKAADINPGTSADLTVASLCLHHLEHKL